MARMESPAGEMELKVLRVEGFKEEMVVTARFGAWDSRVYFSLNELANLSGLMLNPSVIWFLLRFPFLLIARRLLQS
jgi:hypothetical protein